jgi:hypothetical protein
MTTDASLMLRLFGIIMRAIIRFIKSLKGKAIVLLNG